MTTLEVPPLLGRRQMQIAGIGPSQNELDAGEPFDAEFNLVHMAESKLTGSVRVYARVTSITANDDLRRYLLSGMGTVSSHGKSVTYTFGTEYIPAKKIGVWVWHSPVARITTS